jgi:hypothetical protein
MADHEEIVHCCDCKNCAEFETEYWRDKLLCTVWKGLPIVKPTDYCSKGERKKDE